MRAKVRNTYSKAPRIRILIVDDHELVRVGLRDILSSEKDLLVVGEARTLVDALSLLKPQLPDVMLLDARLPDGAGPEVCGRFLAVAPKLCILILTIYAEEGMIVTALKNGAKGYILKDSRAEVIIRAIRAVVGGRTYLDPEIIREKRRRIKARLQQPGSRQGITKISSREWMIMPLLAEGKTNKEIAAQLQLSDKTIGNYIASIFSKLCVKRRTQVAAWYMMQAHSDEYFLDNLVQGLNIR
ncbi:MAG: response regulator transcription factor [Nitrospira sp.]|nr:response regulator transcription factor [Nitrospira sp.]MBH0183048.1 response regulator transcription factor [Nitrospira sp.]